MCSAQTLIENQQALRIAKTAQHHALVVVDCERSIAEAEPRLRAEAIEITAPSTRFVQSEAIAVDGSPPKR
jgi:hypothetical protein